VQWNWREQRFPKADQFNSIHESLVARWRSFLVGRRNADRLHVTCATPMPEDENHLAKNTVYGRPNSDA
jgi:glutathionylspermidine synthase